jgi:hypothetical protein
MESIAWLLDFGDGEIAAVGKRELLHLVPQPEIFEVPRTPRHCSRALIWQSRVVPVWDVRAWLAPGTRTESAPLAAIVGYQSQRRQQPRFGALLLIEPPGRIAVNDSDACELSRGQPGWSKLAISCFLHGENPVAILDLPLMFSAALADSLA